MTDLADLTVESFSPHAGSRYWLQLPGAGEPIALDLVEVNPGLRVAGRDRQDFSLIFRGPLRLRIPQGVYQLDHEVMGRLDLFLVPIAPDPQGALFQAVFT